MPRATPLSLEAPWRQRISLEEARDRISRLTNYECSILVQVYLKGKTKKDAARALGISPGTIGYHLRQIKRILESPFPRAPLTKKSRLKAQRHRSKKTIYRALGAPLPKPRSKSPRPKRAAKNP
jgi:DNA-binding CsgD family transcriptional regulator